MNKMFGRAAPEGGGGLGGHWRAGGAGIVQPPPQLLLANVPPAPTAVHFLPKP